MSCPLCGKVCRCSSSDTRRNSRSAFDPTLESSRSTDDLRASRLVDPEASDTSEEQFAASLAGGPSSGAAARETTLTGIERIAQEIGSTAYNASGPEFYRADDTWRNEVSSRLHSYRARRRKRFDPDASLRLAFEPIPAADVVAQRASERSSAVQRVASRFAKPTASDPVPEPWLPETNVLEFPKPEPPRAVELPRQASLLPSADELAEPVQDTPRILDAPEEELAPVMPSVAAISLENDVEAEALGAPSELDLPLRVASLGQRMLAAMVDGFIVLTAAAGFAMIFLMMQHTIPQSHAAPPIVLVAAAGLWAIYQYLFIVHGGATPGMKMARLAMCSFRGEALDRHSRRGRALAMMVSALPIGLGFAWALLDEDTLCWHDRMSHTCLVKI
jgi:uncharacterized RDD family membrane protein YckC